MTTSISPPTPTPGIDLHAHLSGSIPKHTFITLMRKYLKRQNPVLQRHKKWLMEYYDLSEDDLELEEESSGSSSTTTENSNEFICSYHENTQMPTLQQCFILFACIHEIIQEKEDFQLLVHDVLEEYSKECIYLELRTTPRELKNVANGKAGYVELLLQEIENFMKEQRRQAAMAPEQSSSPVGSFLKVNILLSINRTMSHEEASEVLDLALKYSKIHSELCSVIGMDFSGNPTKNSFSMFSDLFLHAMKEGITLAIHFAEVFNEEDTQFILNFLEEHWNEKTSGVVRLGHGCCMQDEQLEQLLGQNRHAVEICLTSNNIAGMVKDMEDHLVQLYLEKGYPICICCDDRGIFSTSLQQEFRYLRDTYNISEEQCRDIQKKSINYIGELDKKTKEYIQEEYRKRFLQSIHK